MKAHVGHSRPRSSIERNSTSSSSRKLKPPAKIPSVPRKGSQKVAVFLVLGYYATHRLHMMTDRIEKRIELKAPVSRVWRALTDHREFGEWFRVKLEAPLCQVRSPAA